MASLLRISVRSKTSTRTFSVLSKQIRYSSILSRLAPSQVFARTSHASSKLVPLLAGGSSWCCFSGLVLPASSKCESVATCGMHADSEWAQVYQRALAQARQHKFHQTQTGWYNYLRRAVRMFVRATKLMCTLAPVMALYPFWRLLHRRDEDVDIQEVALMTALHKSAVGPLNWYLQLCLGCVEWSGAAVIKLMQWAGSRPDMFGHDFCAVFSRLQDNTTPHAWRHTQRVLKEAYGDNWRDRITIHNKNKSILGSGCIGQVYKGVVLDHEGNPIEVAIKVLHPNVESNIDADLDLMRLLVRAIQKLPWDVFANLKWLNLEGAVEEFADLLKLQLDCRVEAANLEQFNRNFADSPHVVFPKLVDGYSPSKDVLIESFCEGMPVMKFAREHRDNKELLSEMCFVAIETVCKMIFLDNFMHGDLHPGNVFVDPEKKKFVLLDVGIVAAYTDADHKNIVDILAAFIRRQGRLAGRLMIDSSNRLLRESSDHAIDEELFIDKIEAMNKKATTKDYLMEHLGKYITTICDAAAQHHVLINQAFISAALAVKIQEGIAIALDPSIKIYDVAIPVIYESERRRGVATVKEKANQLFGLKNLFRW